jgi:antitoxin YefM
VIDLARDFRTVSDVKANLREALGHVHETKRPLVITVKGKPAAVLMDIEAFEKQRRAMAMFDLLSEAERDVQAERIHPAREVLAELQSTDP